MADIKPVIALAKKNAVSLGSGVVALAAVGVALLVPPGKLAAVQADIALREGARSEVDSLLRTQRKLPTVDVDATEAPPLVGFPNAKAIDAAKAALKQLKEQADAVVAECDAVGHHKALVPEVFTASKGQYQLWAFKFRDDYNAYMPSGLNAIANAGMPPLPEDIAKMVNDEKMRINNTMPIRGAGGTIVNQDEVQAALVRAETAVPQQVRDELASMHACYVNRDTWVPYAGIDSTTGTTPRDQDIWFAQVGLWLQQDIARTIAAANKGSTSVATSPVKHLVKVSFPLVPYGVSVTPRGATDAAVPITGVNPAAPVTLNRATSLTGHVSGAMYDVVKYSMVVRVSEDHVAQFLSEISRDRLHYVTNVDMRTVDSNVEASVTGLTYGKDPVVELAVDAEALFLRKPVENLMPKSVKQLIGIEAPSAATP
jgi:hypothetical protein